jgi:hypothetical protein
MSDKLVPNKGHFTPGHTKLGGRKKTVTKARELVTKYGDPLTWMLRLLRDGVYDAVVIDPVTGKKTKVPTVAPLELLLDCAKSCVGFCHARLSATQLTGADEGPVQSVSLDMTELLKDPELCRQAQNVAIALAESTLDPAPGKDMVVCEVDFVEPSKE